MKKIVALIMLALISFASAQHRPLYSATQDSETLYQMSRPNLPIATHGKCVIDGDYPAYRTMEQYCINDQILAEKQCMPHIDPETGQTYGEVEETRKNCYIQGYGFECVNNNCARPAELNTATGKLLMILIPLTILGVVAVAAAAFKKKVWVNKG